MLLTARLNMWISLLLLHKNVYINVELLITVIGCMVVQNGRTTLVTLGNKFVTKAISVILMSRLGGVGSTMVGGVHKKTKTLLL